MEETTPDTTQPTQSFPLYLASDSAEHNPFSQPNKPYATLGFFADSMRICVLPDKRIQFYMLSIDDNIDHIITITTSIGIYMEALKDSVDQLFTSEHSRPL